MNVSVSGLRLLRQERDTALQQASVAEGRLQEFQELHSTQCTRTTAVEQERDAALHRASEAEKEIVRLAMQTTAQRAKLQ